MPGELNWYSMCCSKENLIIDAENPSPRAQEVLDMWDSDTLEGKVLEKYSRQLNNAFALASFGASTEV